MLKNSRARELELGAGDLAAASGSAALAGLLRPILIVVGIDLLLAPYTSLANDVSVWFQASSNGYFGLGLYDRPGFAYPPLVGNLFVVLGRVLRYTGVSSSSLYSNDAHLRPLVLATQGDFTTIITSPAMNVMLKLIAVVPQIAIALLVVYVVRRCGGTDSRARLAGLAWLFNPLVLVLVGVHAGSLDLFVALFSLLAVALVIDGKPGWAGASLALGVLTKLTPLFIAPVLMATIARRNPTSQDTMVDAAGVGRFVASGVGVFLLVVLPEALSGSMHAMLNGSFLRAQNGLPGVGGLSVFGLRYFQVFHGITTWTFAHSGLVISLNSAIDIAAAVAAAVVIFVANRQLEYSVIAGSAVVYLVVLIVAPVTNPQYLVWSLPFLLVFAGAWNRSFVPSFLLGFAGFWFYLALLGPAARLGPLAEYSSVLSVGHLVQLTGHWYTTPARLWGESHSGDFLAPAAVLAVGIMGYLIGALCRSPAEPDVVAREQQVPSSRTTVRLLASLLVVFVIGGAVAELPAASLRGNVRLAVAKRAGNVIDVRIAGSGSADVRNLRFVAVSLAAPMRDREISVFTDLRYPLSGTSKGAILGFPDHLRSEATLARYEGAVTTVDARGLETEFGDTAGASRRVIVILGGTFPRSVLSAHINLVAPWVRAGGLLVWGGDVIGYYSALPDTALNFEDTSNLRYRGPAELLGRASVRPPADADSLGTLPTTAAQGLGLLYDRTGTAVSSGFAVAHGGAALGWDDGAYNSIVSLRDGVGRYLVFGGGIDSEATAAQDLMRILSSGVATSLAAPIYRTVPANSGSSKSIDFAVPVSASTRYLRLSLLDASAVGVDSWHWNAAVGPHGVTVCREARADASSCS